DGDLLRREHDFVAGLIAAHPDATSSVRAYRFTKEELPRSYELAMVVPPELIDPRAALPPTGATARLGGEHCSSARRRSRLAAAPSQPPRCRRPPWARPARLAARARHYFKGEHAAIGSLDRHIRLVAEAHGSK